MFDRIFVSTQTLLSRQNNYYNSNQQQTQNFIKNFSKLQLQSPQDILLRIKDKWINLQASSSSVSPAEKPEQRNVYLERAPIICHNRIANAVFSIKVIKI